MTRSSAGLKPPRAVTFLPVVAPCLTLVCARRLAICLALLLVVNGAGVQVYAQLAPPVLAVTSTGTRSPSAGEAAFQAWYRRYQLETTVSFRSGHYPIDSMLTVASHEAATWLQRVQQQPITGLQLEPAAGLGARAKDDRYANAQFSASLAAPGRSVSERAYTLYAAVQAYADWRRPEGLPRAEQYLTALAALGASVAPWQYQARELLMRQYYLLGQSADVLRQGNAAIALLPQMPWVDQGLFTPDASAVYSMLVDALTGQADSRAKIDALNTALLATVEPPAALLATDSGSYRNEAYRRKSSIGWALEQTARLGTTGQPWIANYWVNRPTHDSATIAVNDGKIRLVDFFWYRCDGCVMELATLERLKAQFPAIEALGITHTGGYWSNRIVEADEEAQRMEDFFVHKVQLTMPIGIWKATKVRGDDGGVAPEFSNWPTFTAYPRQGKSAVWLLDGQGHIRAIYERFISRDDEQEIARKIAYLEREAATRNDASPAVAKDALPGAGHRALKGARESVAPGAAPPAGQ